MDKSLSGQIVIEKTNDDFNILSQFEMILNNLPPFSYAHYNELEVLMKEMSAYDYPCKTHWENIMKLDKKA